MTTLEAPESVRIAVASSLEPCLATVFDAMRDAAAVIDDLIDSTPGFAALRFPGSHHAHVTMHRYLVREYIRKNSGDMGRWNLNEKVSASGAILLHNGLQTLRFLHQADSKQLPHAGRNRARQEFFTNTAAAQDPALLSAPQNLLGLWNVWDIENLRVLHPLSPGSFTRAPSADLDFIIPASAEDLASWAFRGDTSQHIEAIDGLIDDIEFSGTE